MKQTASRIAACLPSSSRLVPTLSKTASFEEFNNTPRFSTDTKLLRVGEIFRLLSSVIFQIALGMVHFVRVGYANNRFIYGIGSLNIGDKWLRARICIVM
jgi:hypothetical protein